jgi:CRP-like cAMP-binding protein
MKRTDEDARVYAATMRRISPLSDEAVARGLALTSARVLPKGAYLLREGEKAREIAIVISGSLREHFVLASGHERTKAFVFEGGISGSFADLISGAPSRAFIVAEEPTRLLVAELAEHERLGAEWASLRRSATEALLRQKAEREYELLGLDAAARYEAFRARYEGRETRIAAKHVASYLGITPVHLSRLRRQRRAKPKTST